MFQGGFGKTRLTSEGWLGETIRCEHSCFNRLRVCSENETVTCFSPLLLFLTVPHSHPLPASCHSPIALWPLFCVACRLQLCASFLCSLLVRYRYRSSLPPPPPNISVSSVLMACLHAGCISGHPDYGCVLSSASAPSLPVTSFHLIDCFK